MTLNRNVIRPTPLRNMSAKNCHAILRGINTRKVRPLVIKRKFPKPNLSKFVVGASNRVGSRKV